MVNTASLTGTGNLPKFEADLLQDSRATGICSWCRPAEVPLTNLHRGEILDGRELPIRYTAIHPASEAKQVRTAPMFAASFASISSTRSS
jgi:seryl-tRNA synthetase